MLNSYDFTVAPIFLLEDPVVISPAVPAVPNFEWYYDLKDATVLTPEKDLLFTSPADTTITLTTLLKTPTTPRTRG